MRRRAFLAAGLAVLVGARRGPRVTLVERRSWAMGQLVRLAVYHDSEQAGYEAAALALAELRRVEQRLSRFDEASDLAELNRRAGRGPWRVGPDLRAVLEAALAVERRTGGAFNPAVEPLMRLWGFREPRKAAPGAREIAAARSAVRAAVVQLDGDRVTLPCADTALDLGGIGVGYGLDRAGLVLRRARVRAALLDVSGDCLALGAPPGEAGWRIGIADPRDPARVLAQVLLRDRALATSANTVQVVRLGGALRGHVMDPESGYPAQALVQATVVARSGLLADALSTAMLVSGKPVAGVERCWRVGESGAATG